MNNKYYEDMLYNHIRWAELPLPEREYRFASPRKWRFDFAWVDLKIAVEVEGGVWTRGRHTRGEGFMGDIEKYNKAAELGWRLFRYSTDMVDSCYAIDELIRIFGERSKNGEEKSTITR